MVTACCAVLVCKCCPKTERCPNPSRRVQSCAWWRLAFFISRPTLSYGYMCGHQYNLTVLSTASKEISKTLLSLLPEDAGPTYTCCSNQDRPGMQSSASRTSRLMRTSRPNEGTHSGPACRCEVRRLLLDSLSLRYPQSSKPGLRQA